MTVVKGELISFYFKHHPYPFTLPGRNIKNYIAILSGRHRHHLPGDHFVLQKKGEIGIGRRTGPEIFHSSPDLVIGPEPDGAYSNSTEEIPRFITPVSPTVKA